MDGVHHEDDRGHRTPPLVIRETGTDTNGRRVPIEHREPQIENQDVKGRRFRHVEGIQAVHDLGHRPPFRHIDHGVVHRTRQVGIDAEEALQGDRANGTHIVGRVATQAKPPGMATIRHLAPHVPVRHSRPPTPRESLHSPPSEGPATTPVLPVRSDLGHDPMTSPEPEERLVGEKLPTCRPPGDVSTDDLPAGRFGVAPHLSPSTRTQNPSMTATPDDWYVQLSRSLSLLTRSKAPTTCWTCVVPEATTSMTAPR